MKTPPVRVFHTSFKAALSKEPPPAGNLAIPVFSQGSLQAELYVPKERDLQKPHTRDELYVVAQGNGLFFDGKESYEIEPGSFIFVAAGQPHRFERFSDDFAVWVFFYGPEGGESADS